MKVPRIVLKDLDPIIKLEMKDLPKENPTINSSLENDNESPCSLLAQHLVIKTY